MNPRRREGRHVDRAGQKAQRAPGEVQILDPRESPFGVRQDNCPDAQVARHEAGEVPHLHRQPVPGGQRRSDPGQDRLAGPGLHARKHDPRQHHEGEEEDRGAARDEAEHTHQKDCPRLT